MGFKDDRVKILKINFSKETRWHRNKMFEKADTLSMNTLKIDKLQL